MESRSSSSSKGRAGEADVAEILEREGWSIIARNFRAGHGEIDIIAVRGEFIVFVEVKCWERNGPAELDRSIDFGKTRRIIETSKIFLSKYRQYRGMRIRYDVMFLSAGRESRRYEGAFDDTV